MSDYPWESEPDSLFFTDEATGYLCAVLRNKELGSLCGYVRVPPTHPYFAMSYSDDPVLALDVHGGVTYANAWPDGYAGKDHVPGTWCFGFDCAHFRDLLPNLPLQWHDREYRDIAFVKNECEELAEQLFLEAVKRDG